MLQSYQTLRAHRPQFSPNFVTPVHTTSRSEAQVCGISRRTAKSGRPPG